MSLTYKDGKVVDISGKRGTLKSSLTNLTDAQRKMVLSAVLLQKVKMDSAAQAVVDQIVTDGSQVMAAKMLRTEFHVSMKSVRITNRKYDVKVESKPIGTVTSVESDGLTKCVWGSRMPGDTFSGKAVVAEMVSSCFVKKDGRMTIRPFSKSKELRQLMPTSNPFGNFEGLAQESPTPQVLKDKCMGFLEENEELNRMWVEQLADMAPPAVTRSKNGVRAVKHGNTMMLKKASPTVAGLQDKVRFGELVSQVALMTPAIGSKKDGMGRLSAAHYDGHVGLEPGIRKKQVFIDDYIPVDCDVYFVASSDAAFVNALYRKIDDYNSDQFVVVYKSKNMSPEFKKCLIMEGGSHVIASSGVVGCPEQLWSTIRGLKTCYLSFNSITKKGSTGVALMESSREDVMMYRTIVKGYTHYQFYGFVGGMDEGDRCISSVGGRDGRVIFVDKGRGKYDRLYLAKVAFQMVRHAILFPWMQACYMLERDGKMVFPGARPIFGRYDFTPLDKRKGFLTSITDDQVVKELLDEQYAKFFEGGGLSGETGDAGEKEEKVAEEPESFFDVAGVDI